MKSVLRRFGEARGLEPGSPPRLALAHGVYPSTLADQGLPEALQAATLRIPLAATVESAGVGRYPQEVESAVCFCCLEAMQNASKRAREAKMVTIFLAEDDELKFEAATTEQGSNGTTRSGAGLTNMRDRLGAVGGALEIHSAPGEGTVVAGSIPLSANGRSGSAQRAGELGVL